MKIVCISDTHAHHELVLGGIPDGDVLIHAGDLCGLPRMEDVESFLRWFGAQPHRHKIFIAGNHDGPFALMPALCRRALDSLCPAVHYLQDSSVEFEDVVFYGSPWQPAFGDWFFNLPRGRQLAERWAKIPLRTDVLITHGPPHGILDQCPGVPDRTRIDHAGCEDMTRAIARVRPKLHVFGHIHEGYGRLDRDGTIYVNASSMDGRYRPMNRAIVVEL